MLKTYNKIFSVIFNGEKTETNSSMVIEDESATKEIIHEVSWDNLDNFLYEYAWACSFSLEMTKKGKKLMIMPLMCSIKQWITPNLNMKIKISYEEETFSIKKILEYHDSNAAIRYLVERGKDALK